MGLTLTARIRAGTRLWSSLKQAKKAWRVVPAREDLRRRRSAQLKTTAGLAGEWVVIHIAPLEEGALLDRTA